MISSNDFRNGVTIVIDGQLWTVIDFLHVKPGKGSAFVRTRLKNVKTGSTVERTFRAGEKLERATVDNRSMQMLYNDVELIVQETDPGFKGDTAQGTTKPAKLETGATVNVPLFVNPGDVIRIDTRDRRYIGRVQS